MGVVCARMLAAQARLFLTWQAGVYSVVMDDFSMNRVPPRSALIHYDARVVIHGLVGAPHSIAESRACLSYGCLLVCPQANVPVPHTGAPQHNGTYGRIVDHDVDTGRYQVRHA